MKATLSRSFITWESDKFGRIMLCRNNQWKSLVWFGTYGGCLKIYRAKGWAERAAAKLRTEVPSSDIVTVRTAHDGETINNNGTITKYTKL